MVWVVNVGRGGFVSSREKKKQNKARQMVTLHPSIHPKSPPITYLSRYHSSWSKGRARPIMSASACSCVRDSAWACVGGDVNIHVC